MEQIRRFEPLFGAWYADSFIGTDGSSRVYRIFREENGVKQYAVLKYVRLPAGEAPAGVYDVMAQGLRSRIALIASLRGEPNIMGYDSQLIRPDGEGGYDILLRTELLENLTGRIASGRVKKEDAVRLGVDCLSALEACHEAGAIHGDIKPDNVFITADGRFKLGDIGLSRCLARPDKKEIAPAGSYTAPEVASGGRYSPACDICSLGVIMYRMLNNGRLPFVKESPSSSEAVGEALSRRLSGEALPDIPGVDKKLMAIVRRACAFRPENRFASASDMKRALLEYSAPAAAPLASAKAVPPAAAAAAPASAPITQQTKTVYPTEEKPKKKKTGLIIGLIAGGVGLLLLLGLIAALVIFLVKKNNVKQEAAAPTQAPEVVYTQAPDPTQYVTPEPAPETQPPEVPTEAPTESPTEVPYVTFNDRTFENAFRKATGMNGNITEADLLGVTSLKLDECSLTDISDVAKLKNLKVLYLRHNNIHDISAVRDLKGLEDLSLRDNIISDLTPLSGLTKLTELGLSDNYISDLTPLSGLTNLTELYLHDNNITDISPISGLIRLEELQIYNNAITDIGPLRNMTRMKELLANNNNITNIEGIRYMTELTTLKLNDNFISDIGPLYNMTKLKVLCLGTNNISDLSPLWYMTELEELHLKRNNITDVWALSNLKKLKILSIYENRIYDISPLYGLTKLESLKIKDNPIPKEQVAYIKSLLTGCKVES